MAEHVIFEVRKELGRVDRFGRASRDEVAQRVNKVAVDTLDNSLIVVVYNQKQFEKNYTSKTKIQYNTILS